MHPSRRTRPQPRGCRRRSRDPEAWSDSWPAIGRSREVRQPCPRSIARPAATCVPSHRPAPPPRGPRHPGSPPCTSLPMRIAAIPSQRPPHCSTDSAMTRPTAAAALTRPTSPCRAGEPETTMTTVPGSGTQACREDATGPDGGAGAVPGPGLCRGPLRLVMAPLFASELPTATDTPSNVHSPRGPAGCGGPTVPLHARLRLFSKDITLHRSNIRSFSGTQETMDACTRYWPWHRRVLS